MDFVHRCGFCEWERPADSPTLVEPRCPNCGCLLSAHRRREEERSAAPATTLQWTNDLVRLLLVFARIAAVVAVVAAARAGYVLGGAPIALVGFGIVALAAVGVVFPSRSSR